MSIEGKKSNNRRNFEEAYQRLYWDYFGADPKYDEKDLEKKFRIPRSVFQRIYTALVGKGIFCEERGLHKKEWNLPFGAYHRSTSDASHGAAEDSLDEYIQTGDESIGLSMNAFFASSL